MQPSLVTALAPSTRKPSALAVALAASPKPKPKPKPQPKPESGGKKTPKPLPGYPIRVGLDAPTMWGGKKASWDPETLPGRPAPPRPPKKPKPDIR